MKSYDLWRMASGRPRWLSRLYDIGIFYNQLEEVEEIDDEMLLLARKEKRIHDDWLRKNNPRTLSEALLVFPEAKKLFGKTATVVKTNALKENFEQAKLARIEDVVTQYVDIKKSGARIIGKCPFHNDKNPSFVVYRDTNSFHCFGCKTSGNAINFVMKIERLTFKEAIKLLSNLN